MWDLEWSFISLWMEATFFVAVTWWVFNRLRRLERGRKAALRRLNGA
jgi:cbb3-type cytochrome oxidase subunit 3